MNPHTGITWYNDAAAKATHETFRRALQPLLDQLMPGFIFETVGINRQNDVMRQDELVQLRIHLRRPAGMGYTERQYVEDSARMKQKMAEEDAEQAKRMNFLLGGGS